MKNKLRSAGVLIAVSAIVIILGIVLLRVLKKKNQPSEGPIFSTTIIQAAPSETGTCEEGERCINVVSAGNNTWNSPTGKICYWRNACPNNPMQACCK